jgi:tRNA threonylcarbamoyladenosine biosynthesis protein TsaB
MLLLALDTTARLGSLALAREGKCIKARRLEAPEGFGHVVFQEINDLLASCGVGLPEVDLYAAAAGPGSFTGIRVGLTAVKALAEIRQKPVLAVSNLLALAAAAPGRFRAPVLDARRGEVYAAVYDDRLRPVVDEVVTPWKEFLALLGGREVTFAGLDKGLFNPGGAAPLNCGEGMWQQFILDVPFAAVVAETAFQLASRGAALAPEAADANYVRRPDAELNWRPPV